MHPGNLPAQTQAGRRQERNHHQSPVTSLPAWSIKGRETSPLNLVLPPPHIIVMHWWCSRQVVSGSCNPMDCKAIVHARLLWLWILQPRILEWIAISFSRGSSWPRNWTWVSCIVGRFWTDWAMREAPFTMHYIILIIIIKRKNISLQ